MLKTTRNHRDGVKRSGVAIGALAGVAALTLGACSTNSSNTGATTSPSATSPSSSVSTSPTGPSPSPTTAYQLSSGGRVAVSGDSTRWAADGGVLRIAAPGGVKSGSQAASIAVDATSRTAGGPSGWILNLVTNSSGQVVSGTLDSPGVRYTVSKPSGKLVFAVKDGRLSIATQQAIAVVRSGQAATTMTIALTGTISS